MKIKNLLSIIIVMLALLPLGLSAKVIEVTDPGDHQDLQPYFQAAVDAALPGDEIVLPAGEFFVDGRVVVNKFIKIRGQGKGPGGTKLYRREEISDSTLSSWTWRMFIYVNMPTDAIGDLVISDIYFKGQYPSLSSGDGGSLAADNGIRIDNTRGFVIANCRFEHFGAAGIRVKHRDRMANGLIYNNEFIHNYKYNLDLGYGVSIYGNNTEWVPDPEFGTDNFIFIENNYFKEHRHSVSAGGSARYVFRYNEVVDNLWGHAVDAHEARGGTIGESTSYFSTRAYEVYNNHLHNTVYKDGVPITTPRDAAYLVRTAFGFRGGEGVVHNNKIEQYRIGFELFVFVHFPDDGPYPISYQIGWESGKNLGPNHTGTDAEALKGDLFEWDNDFVYFDPGDAILRKFYTYYESPDRLLKDRDYHRDTPRPGYSPYTYPHPRRSLVEPPVQKTITISIPNGGESWTEGTFHQIKWNASGLSSMVKVEYSLDNGSSWLTIAPSTPNDGNYNWTLPLVTSTQCLVKVSDAADPNAYDVSDNVFSIDPQVVQPELRLTAPNGGESIAAKSAYNVTWTSAGAIDKVKLEYSLDSGSTWALIADQVYNDGAYSWPVPDAASSTCLVRVTDTAGAASDVGDGTFSIVRTEAEIPVGPGYMIIGHSNSFTNGGSDFLLYKTNSNGVEVWRKNFGGAGDDVGLDLVKTADNGYIMVGYGNSYTNGGNDFLVYKLDSSGAIVWRKNFGGAGEDRALGVAATPDGGCLVAGYSDSLTNGGTDFLIYRLAANGNVTWRKNLGGVQNDQANSIAASTDGNYYVAGFSESYTKGMKDFMIYKLDIQGNVLWSDNFGGSYDDVCTDVEPTSDGGCLLTGYSRSFTFGGSDFLLFKIRSDGKKQGRKNYGGSNDDFGMKSRQTADGNYVISGYSESYTNGGCDFLAYKIDPRGKPFWMRNLGELNNDIELSITETSTGDLMMVGYSETVGGGETDVQLFTIDNNGNFKSSQKLGGSNYDYASSLVEVAN